MLFLKAKVPLSVCISYLITSPLINPIIIMVFIVSFGVNISLIYIGFLYIIILFFAFLLSKIDTRKFLSHDFLENDFNKNTGCCVKNCCSNKKEDINFKQFFISSLKEYEKILPYIIIGVFIGSIIYGVFPKDFFEFYLKDYGILGIVIAAFVGGFALYELHCNDTGSTCFNSNGRSFGDNDEFFNCRSWVLSA